MEILFWASLALILYVYLGYPLLLVAWSRVHPRRSALAAPSAHPSHPSHPSHLAPPAPPVSILLAVRNEAGRLRARVDNLLSQDYDGNIEIIVVSDGSSDDPRAALSHAPANVRLIEIPARGKAAALNAGAAAASHDILVFADARQTFAPDALRYLVAPFGDVRIGGVTGELLLDTEQRTPDDPDGSVAEGVGLYWRYEKSLRRMESTIGSTLGATGAIYALRKSLWRPLPEDTLLDDVLAPMRAVLAGHIVVFEDRAKAFDRGSRDAATESRRKVRTLAGNVQILWLEPRLLVPVVNPVWWQYVSHKIGRLLVPYGLIALVVASISLSDDHWFYELALMGQLAFYALAFWGALLADRVARLALTFVVLNYSAVAGTVAAVMRRKVWR
jgi:biofilm PGA synthesis N-glycosyltransferase PgaC